ncbi:MAG: response regulator transcription factor [Dysgonamonadaceae bacterium]|jgi:DNA-binding NarL/FixJ family response regulator|nr:response regulator transcription factor [Dysgonamonadaceae bacterium]
MNSSVFILADNQDISKAGIRYLLEEAGFTGKIYEVENKKNLIQRLSENEDATVVLDYTDFDFNNIENLLAVEYRFQRVRWILFSEELSYLFLKRIYLEEAFNIVLKSSTLHEIKQALGSSRRYICPQVMSFIFDSHNVNDMGKPVLTPSEQEILKLIAFGKSVKEIAEERFVSIHTINTHKKNIFRKLDVNNMHEATKYAIRSGLVDLVEYYI